MGLPTQPVDIFAQFAEERLGAVHFVPTEGDRTTDLFYASIESARVLFSWTHGLKNRSGEAFDPHFGFVEDQRPNALADVWNRHQMVAMHSSLFSCLSEFAFFCFTQRDFFPDVGNPDAETSPSPWNDQVPGLWLLEFTEGGGRVRDEHSAQLIPKDTDRYFAGLWLGQLMTRFVWLHELSHCFNGHVGYSLKHKLAPRLYELSDPLTALSNRGSFNTPEKIEARQCLEFDADQSALWASFNIQWRDMENMEGVRALDLPLRLRLTLFGAYALVWLIDRFQDYLDVQDDKTHPPPSLRLQNLFRTAASRIVTQDDALAALHTDVLRQFDVMQRAIPSIYGTDDLISRITDRALMDALEAYDPRLDEIKAALKDFEFSAAN